MTAGEDSGDTAPEEEDEDDDEAFGSTWEGGGGVISPLAKVVPANSKLVMIYSFTVCFEATVAAKRPQRSDLTSDLKSMAQTAFDLTLVLFVLASVRHLFELC